MFDNAILVTQWLTLILVYGIKFWSRSRKLCSFLQLYVNYSLG